MNETDIARARLTRPKRKLTSFIAQELLYDYLQGALDKDRSEAIDELLITDESLKKQYQSIKDAESYLTNLSHTTITTAHLAELSNLKTKKQIFKKELSWSNWPDYLKWGAEAFVVSGAVALLFIFIPWENMSLHSFKINNQVVLSEINNSKKVDTILPEFQESDEQLAGSPQSMKSEEKQIIVKSNSKDKLKKEETSVAVIADESEEEIIPTKPPATVQKGFLFRFSMNLENSEDKAKIINQKIVELGGKKAGQVPLGWRKINPSGNYFHFTMPDSNYQELLSALGEHGTVRVTKNKHERVMPEGQIRAILWISDQTAQQSKTEVPSEAPAENTLLNEEPVEDKDEQDIDTSESGSASPASGEANLKNSNLEQE